METVIRKKRSPFTLQEQERWAECVTRDEGEDQAAYATNAKSVGTCSAAVFCISGVAGYFEGEIVKESCDHFEQWVQQPAPAADVDETRASLQSDRATDVAQRDPEMLAAGHRTFLAALVYALLLTDVPFTRELRSLLGNLDAFIAFFIRLLDLQQMVDLERDTERGGSLTEEDERKAALELDRARKKVDSDLRSVVGRLRQLDHERIGAARYLDTGAVENGCFVPWKGGGLDRLLMKLEFGRMTEEDYDIV